MVKTLASVGNRFNFFVVKILMLMDFLYVVGLNSYLSIAIMTFGIKFFAIFQGDLGSYLQKKGRISPSKALKYALDVARQVVLCHKSEMICGNTSTLW